jgi:hypothetical protein
MPFRWRKSIRIAPGLKLNLSHRGVRAQVGSSPLSISAPLIGGSKAKRLTATLPGTGLSFVHTLAPLTKKPSKRRRGEYELSEDLSLSDLFLAATTEAAVQQKPALQINDLPLQSPDVLRTIFKTATWNLAVLAGHDPAKKPFLVTDALLALDGEPDEGLVELAKDCIRLTNEVSANLNVSDQQTSPPSVWSATNGAVPLMGSTTVEPEQSNVLGIVLVVGLIAFTLGYCAR